MQVVDDNLEGGMAAVTAAVKRCLQFYVDASAITAKTEASLRILITSLESNTLDSWLADACDQAF